MSVSDVDEVTLDLAGLQVNKDLKVEEVVQDLGVLNLAKDEDRVNDDGYISSNSSENLSFAPKDEALAGKDDKDEDDDDDDDERILEPLVIVNEKQAQPEVKFVSRGPVYLDTQTPRLQSNNLYS